MPFDPDSPVLALVIKPGDDVATYRFVAANSPSGLADALGGEPEAIEIDGGSVLWLDESGKNRNLPTNLLATKIAHRLHAGLFPDDTVNGTAVIVGEAEGPTGDLVSTHVTTATLDSVRGAGITISD